MKDIINDIREKMEENYFVAFCVGGFIALCLAITTACLMFLYSVLV